MFRKFKEWIADHVPQVQYPAQRGRYLPKNASKKPGAILAALIAFSPAAMAEFKVPGMPCESIGNFVGDAIAERQQGRTEQQQMRELRNAIVLAGGSYAKFEPGLASIIHTIYAKPFWLKVDPVDAVSVATGDCMASREGH